MINPKPAELAKATLEFIVAGSLDFILMVEGEASEIQEDEMVEAIQFAHEEIKRHCQAQVELTKLVGKEVKRTYSHEKSDAALYDHMRAATYDKLFASVNRQIANKSERAALVKEIKEEYVASLGEDHGF